MNACKKCRYSAQSWTGQTKSPAESLVTLGTEDTADFKNAFLPV